MDVILTHEQADFDALASMLGAHLVDEAAIPVLPRRLNRNVRAFLTLYGNELPFLDPRDLPSEPISSVTLVDTQAMITLKGMSSNMQVRVIDHHPPRPSLPSAWIVDTQGTGATTTLLVEGVTANDCPLTPVQATLLLLGIYEDTGSLTYSRTTSRDLRAAAFLVDQGANLKIASDFLHHPLSQQQQSIYDRLRASLEHYHILGHTIVIAWGDAQDTDEELSTVAHKLRDLLDPDALFILIATRGGVQMIARSDSENIDVATIVAEFGGGGHERAAAGLIRGRDLQSVRAELMRILPRFVRPAVTVAQIMSRDPQVLSPDSSVEAASERMRRYGYEGFPVVKDGKVIGLLTRRAVDRALAHRLNLPASSLMEAGEVTLNPDDSIEQVQRLMTDTGWGQVPVVDPQSKAIVGIVTRTDLLKTLPPHPNLPGRQNLADRLEAALSPARLRLLQLIADAAHEQHVALYIVGGFVRDLLLNHPSLDFDLVVEGDAIVLARKLAQLYGGRITSHSRFGTAKWHLPQAITTDQTASSSGEISNIGLTYIDLITARTEFYTQPTALPIVEPSSIKLDLHRRDFTINTLALRLDGRHYGELHDYWGGLTDLRHSLVRVLHSLSFVDDPTRMLRAVRFEQRFSFHIEGRSLELLEQALSLLDRVSGDRIRHELNHILIEDKLTKILERLDSLKLLTAIHPNLAWDLWLCAKFEQLKTDLPRPDWDLPQKDNHTLVLLAYSLWLVRLPPYTAEPVCVRLKLTASQTTSILAASNLFHELPALASASPSQITFRLETVPPLARYAVYLATSDQGQRRVLQAYTSYWQYTSPSISGEDLKKRGIPPGPIYREILSTLRAAWLDGEITSVHQETACLEKIIENTKLS